MGEDGDSSDELLTQPHSEAQTHANRRQPPSPLNFRTSVFDSAEWEGHDSVRSFSCVLDSAWVESLIDHQEELQKDQIDSLTLFPLSPRVGEEGQNPLLQDPLTPTEIEQCSREGRTISLSSLIDRLQILEEATAEMESFSPISSNPDLFIHLTAYVLQKRAIENLLNALRTLTERGGQEKGGVEFEKDGGDFTGGQLGLLTPAEKNQMIATPGSVKAATNVFDRLSSSFESRWDAITMRAARCIERVSHNGPQARCVDVDSLGVIGEEVGEEFSSSSSSSSSSPSPKEDGKKETGKETGEQVSAQEVPRLQQRRKGGTKETKKGKLEPQSEGGTSVRKKSVEGMAEDEREKEEEETKDNEEDDEDEERLLVSLDRLIESSEGLKGLAESMKRSFPPAPPDNNQAALSLTEENSGHQEGRSPEANDDTQSEQSPGTEVIHPSCQASATLSADRPLHITSVPSLALKSNALAPPTFSFPWFATSSDTAGSGPAFLEQPAASTPRDAPSASTPIEPLSQRLRSSQLGLPSPSGNAALSPPPHAEQRERRSSSRLITSLPPEFDSSLWPTSPSPRASITLRAVSGEPQVPIAGSFPRIPPPPSFQYGNNPLVSPRYQTGTARLSVLQRRPTRLSQRFAAAAAEGHPAGSERGSVQYLEGPYPSQSLLSPRYDLPPPQPRIRPSQRDSQPLNLRGAFKRSSLLSEAQSSRRTSIISGAEEGEDKSDRSASVLFERGGQQGDRRSSVLSQDGRSSVSPEHRKTSLAPPQAQQPPHSALSPKEEERRPSTFLSQNQQSRRISAALLSEATRQSRVRDSIASSWRGPLPAGSSLFPFPVPPHPPPAHHQQKRDSTTSHPPRPTHPTASDDAKQPDPQNRRSSVVSSSSVLSFLVGLSEQYPPPQQSSSSSLQASSILPPIEPQAPSGPRHFPAEAIRFLSHEQKEKEKSDPQAEGSKRHSLLSAPRGSVSLPSITPDGLKDPSITPVIINPGESSSMSVPRPQRRVSWGNFHTLEFDKDKRDLELRKGIQHLPISPSSAAMNIPTGTGKSQKGGLRRASSDPLTETGASRGRRASAPSPTSKQAEGLDASRGGGANFLQAVQRQQQQKQMPTPSGLLGLTAIAASSSISPKELLQGSPQAHTDVVRRRQSAPLPRSPSPITRPPGPLPSSLGGSPETSEAQRRGSLSQTVQSKAKQKEVPTDPSSSSSSLPPPVFYPSAEELQPTSLEAFPLSDYLGKRDRDQGEPSGTGEENSLLDPSVSLSFNEKAPAYQEKTKLPGPSRLNNERQFLASVLLSANPLRFPSCLLPAAESEDSGVVDPPGCDFELGGEGASSASASGTACVSQSWMLPSLPSEDQEKEKERLQIKAEEEKEEIDAGRYLDSWQSSSDIFGLAAWRDHLMLNVPSWVSLSPSPCQRRGDGSNRNRTNKSSQRQKEHLQKKVAVDTQKKKKDSPKPKGPPPKTSLSRLLNPLAYINRPPRLTFRPPPAPPATRVPPPSTPPNRVTNPNPILHFSSIEEEAPTFGEPSVSSSAVPQTRHTPGRFCAAIRAPILEEPSAPVLRPQRVPLREGDRGLPLPVDERTAVISGDDIVHGGPGVKGGIFSNTKEEEEEEECLGLGILCQDSLAAWRRRAEPRPERAHQRSLASLPDAASSSCTDGSTGPRTSLQPDLSLPRLGGPRPLVCLPPEQRHPNNHSGSASGSVSQDEEERRRSGARELHSCSVTDVTAEGAITDPVVRCESREGAGEWRVRKSKDKGGKGIVREKEVNREGKKGKEERGDPKKTKEQSGKMEMEQERREGETSHRRPLRFASSSS